MDGLDDVRLEGSGHLQQRIPRVEEFTKQDSLLISGDLGYIGLNSSQPNIAVSYLLGERVVSAEFAVKL